MIRSHNIHPASVLFSEVDSQGVAVVGEHGAGAAHVHLLHAAVHAARAVEGRVVCAAAGLGSAPELDVAAVHGVAPALAPRVLDQPVVAVSGVSSVPGVTCSICVFYVKHRCISLRYIYENN